MLICLAIGHIIIRNKPQKTALLARDGFVTVAFSWIVLSLFGSIPFMLTGVTESFIDAFFETVSGFTTTGATIFADVEILPRSIITWRSFTHWIGGMGVLVFIMAFLPLSGANNMNIMKAESPGPEVSKLVPKVRSTAIWLYGVYIGLTLVQFVLLLFGDMNVFEAFNTALSTAGTGGFGFRNDSLASFSSYTQIVVAIFMLLFSINFGSYFLILRGKLKGVLTSEIELFVLIVMGAVVCIAFNNADMFSSYSESFKHSFFSVASIISTTGFMSIDFDLWHEFSKSVIVILMLIGACAGSTGGGIKVSRIIIIFKVMGRELSTALRPKQVKKITIDGQVQDLSVVKAVYGYIFCFIAVFVISVLLISFEGYDLVTNFTSVAATVGNVGPGLEKVGPVMNYGFFSPFSKLVLCFDMLAGRLEFYPILLLFVPSTWRK
jgi:trk system potassium uptake protein TrkH